MAFALFLSFVLHTPAVSKNHEELTFEDRAAMEKASRTSYRKFEIASLIVVFTVGAGAVYWVTRRRKP
ncbi:MAG: hypothetical protein FWF95_00475 [Syntrophorhabdaceae bacterium]|nr:hypothetical protein [Syntrophorhabdaceae bacterium]